jgi:hypothetical protein
MQRELLDIGPQAPPVECEGRHLGFAAGRILYGANDLGSNEIAEPLTLRNKDSDDDTGPYEPHYRCQDDPHYFLTARIHLRVSSL